jgi:glycosyltransferase involved in cell wall biosynthesis
MNKKEVIMFCPEYWWDKRKGKMLRGKIDEIEKWGGQGRVVAEISERLPYYGYHVSVLARLAKSKHSDHFGIYPNSYYQLKNIAHYRPVDGVDVYGIPACSNMGERVQPRSGTLYIDNPPDCIVTWDHVFTSINYIHDFNKKLEEKLKDLENTLIHGHDFFGAQFIYNIKTARKLPDSFCVLSIHMSSDREEDEIKRDERLQWELKGCKLADKVHVVSKYQMEIIKNKYHIRPKKMFYIPNGVDLEKFRPAKDEEKTEDEEILKKYGLNQKKYIAFWGRMEPVKGISNLIKGFDRIVKRNPEYELVILSIPSNWEYYHNEVLKIYGGLSQEVKSKVKIFTEKFPEKELFTLLRNA